MNTLQARKQLLIAESNMNRVLLVRDCAAVTGGIWSAAAQVKKVAGLASAAGMVVSLLKMLRR